MFKHFGSRILVICCVAIAALVLSGVLLAQSASADEPGAVAPAANATAPDIVRQLPNLMTTDSESYLLSNGQRRTVVHQQQVRFRDAQGNWQDINTGLITAGAPGQYRSAQTPFGFSLDATQAGAPVQLSTDGLSMSFAFPSLGQMSAVVLGGTVTCTTAAVPAAVSYRVTSRGFEQTISLTSAKAPNSYSCVVTHPGLALRQGSSGVWGFYSSTSLTPLAVISNIMVSDSSASAGGEPAFCADATMTVTPGQGQSVLTFSVPRSWLNAPERTYPVQIDPTVSLHPATAHGSGSNLDTFIRSAQPDTQGSSGTTLMTGNNATYGYTRAFMGFDLSSIAGGSGQLPYIHSAQLSVYKYASGGSSPTVFVGRVNQSWDWGATWNSLGCVVNSFPSSLVTNIGNQTSVGVGWLPALDCTATVQSWVNGTQPNYGFMLYQAESGTQSTTAYLSSWRAADYGSNTPTLTVDYDPGPEAAARTDQSVYTWGNTVNVNVKVNTFYQDEVRWIESGLNLASADSSSWRGVVGWFKTSSLPSTRWHTAGTLPDGSVVAYYSDSANPTDYGADKVTLVSGGCNDGYIWGSGSTPGYRRIQFALTIGQNFGSLVGASADTRFGMGPTSTVIWGPTGYLTGDLTHPATSVGWTAQTGASFSVIDTAVNTLTYTAAGSAWFNSTTGADDTNDQGRGAFTLMWPQVSGASGYHIYVNDGNGTYRQVGATVGAGAILWSSSGTAFYPKDSEINALSAPSSANPYYRATTPADATTTTASTLQTQVTPSPAPSPTASPGSGVLVSDGTYVYEHRWGTFGGPTKWTPIGTGNGNTLGLTYNPIGPDISTIGGNSYSAFFLGGYLYNGATVSPTNATTATVVGVKTADGTTQNFTFSGASPLDRSSGATITAVSNNLLLTSGVDSDGTPHIYSVAYTLSTNADGSARYDGYKVREYSSSGAYVADHTLSMATGTSEYIDGVMADGSFLYLIKWSGADGAHVIKISTQSWQITNQWGINQGQTHAISGCYDQTNNCFWLGALDTNRIYKYSGSGNGLDLRDNPNALYAKTANGQTAIPKWTAYDVKVVPYADNGSGVSTETTPATPAAYKVAATLDNRTYSNNADPQHTTTDLGGWDNHAAQARLDTGALEVDTTDLAIASWGPSAQLSRTYLSGNAQSKFAPGWRFDFEQSLDLSGVGSGTIDYYDAVGDKHHLVLAGSVWKSPDGFLATLAAAGSNWTLTYTDGTVWTFGSTGALQSEADRYGNQVAYVITASTVTITAANSQHITVNLSGGKVTSATYQTSDGTREVDYQTASPWQVTYYPGSSAQRQVTYGYDGSSRLTAVNQVNWPSSGQTATESFSYGSGGLSEVRSADYNATTKPDARATIDYLTSTSAKVSHGTASQPVKVSISGWSDQTGAETTRAEWSATSSENATTEFNYAANGQLADSVTMATDANNKTIQNVSASDANGNLLEESNGGIGLTASAYGDAANPNLPTQVTDPLQGVVANTYDSHGGLTATQQTLNAAGDISRTESTYDSQGRLTQQKQLIAGTPSNNPVWAVTDFSNFAPNGQPQTTIHRGVLLSYGGTAQDLSETATYDAFGNLLTKTATKTDSSPTIVTETDTYDLAGELLTQTDAVGTVTHHTFDALGNDTQQWQSAPTTSVKADWKQTTYDALGRVLTQTTLLSDAGGNGTTENVTTNTWDGLGNELTADSSTLGGQPAKWLYDDRGNVIEQWDEGVVDYTDARGTRKTYDASGNVLGTTSPGDGGATTFGYAPDGNLASQTGPDGSWVSYAYDANANKTAETRPKHGYSGNHALVATTQYAYDYVNRQVSETKPGGLTTTMSYDELGRQTGAQGGTGPSTGTTYNTLGWVLRSVDANGVTDSKTYDGAGRLVSEVKGSQNATSSVYDDDNRLTRQTDPDGRILDYTYNAFGVATEEKHTVGGTVTKDFTIVPDSIGRPASRTDSVSGEAHTWTYPVNTAAGVTETVTCGSGTGAVTTVSRDARNQETQRSANIGTGTNVVRTIDSRDAAERATQATLQTNNVQHWAFDATNGRLTRQWGSGWAAGAANSDAYTYDADIGLKTGDSLQLGLGGTITGTYTYDAQRRLATAAVNSPQENYTFDSEGNLAQVVVGSTTQTYVYDNADRLTEKDINGVANTIYLWNTTYGWRTSQGPTSGNQPITCGYTAGGRLATYADTTRSLTATYAYDAAGQRSRSAVTVGTTTTTTDFAYEGLTLNQLSASQTGGTTWKISYLYDENGRPYAGVYRNPATSTTPTVFGLVTTDRGDVVELLDSNGNPFACYHYDAWGNPVGGTNDQWSRPTGITTQATSLITSQLAADLASRQILRYAGYAYDAESYLYYCSARSYDPATRQFTSVDPEKADKEESAFQYCAGDPVGKSDPAGLRYASCWIQFHNDWIFRIIARWSTNGKVTWDESLRYQRIVRSGSNIPFLSSVSDSATIDYPDAEGHMGRHYWWVDTAHASYRHEVALWVGPLIYYSLTRHYATVTCYISPTKFWQGGTQDWIFHVVRRRIHGSV